MDGITNSKDMSLSKLQEIVRDREVGMLLSMGSQRVRHNGVTELIEFLAMPVKFPKTCILFFFFKSHYEATITLILKPDKDTTKKKITCQCL